MCVCVRVYACVHVRLSVCLNCLCICLVSMSEEETQFRRLSRRSVEWDCWFLVAMSMLQNSHEMCEGETGFYIMLSFYYCYDLFIYLLILFYFIYFFIVLFYFILFYCIYLFFFGGGEGDTFHASLYVAISFFLTLSATFYLSVYLFSYLFMHKSTNGTNHLHTYINHIRVQHYEYFEIIWPLEISQY